MKNLKRSTINPMKKKDKKTTTNNITRTFSAAILSVLIMSLLITATFTAILSFPASHAQSGDEPTSDTTTSSNDPSTDSDDNNGGGDDDDDSSTTSSDDQSSDGSDTDSSTEGATEPEQEDEESNAVGEQTATAGEESGRLAVEANGADYTVVEGHTLTFEWTITTDPQGLTVTLEMTRGPSGATFPTVTGPAPQTGTFTWKNAGPPGTYMVTLQSTCPECSNTIFTQTFTIEVMPANQPPTANAGADKTVNEGETVRLVGSASTDPDGTIVSYSWTQTAGTKVTLNGASSATPTFTAPNVGPKGETLIFKLTVTDNDGETATDFVNVIVNDVKGGGGNGNPGGGGNGDPPSGDPPGTNPPGRTSVGGYPIRFTITQTGTAQLDETVGIFPAGTYDLRVEISGQSAIRDTGVFDEESDVTIQASTLKATLVIDQVNGDNDTTVKLRNIGPVVWLASDSGIVGMEFEEATFDVASGGTGQANLQLIFGKTIQWGQSSEATESNIRVTVQFSDGTATFDDDPGSATGELKFRGR